MGTSEVDASRVATFRRQSLLPPPIDMGSGAEGLQVVNEIKHLNAHRPIYRVSYVYSSIQKKQRFAIRTKGTALPLVEGIAPIALPVPGGQANPPGDFNEH